MAAPKSWSKLFKTTEHSNVTIFKSKRNLSRTIALKAKPESSFEQLYLDFGQKTKEGHCAQCGMRYIQGVPMDEEEHRKYHRKVLARVVVRGSAAERTLCQRPDGFQIVAIHCVDAPERLRKMSEVRQLLEHELGCPIDMPSGFRALLCLASGGRLVGCAVVHPLTIAFKLMLSSTDCPQDGKFAILQHDGLPEHVMCGISHIWVAPEHRRARIGWDLLDTAR